MLKISGGSLERYRSNVIFQYYSVSDLINYLRLYVERIIQQGYVHGPQIERRENKKV